MLLQTEDTKNKTEHYYNLFKNYRISLVCFASKVTLERKKCYIYCWCAPFWSRKPFVSMSASSISKNTQNKTEHYYNLFENYIWSLVCFASKVTLERRNVTPTADVPHLGPGNHLFQGLRLQYQKIHIHLQSLQHLFLWCHPLVLP